MNSPARFLDRIDSRVRFGGLHRDLDWRLRLEQWGGTLRLIGEDPRGTWRLLATLHALLILDLPAGSPALGAAAPGHQLPAVLPARALLVNPPRLTVGALYVLTRPVGESCRPLRATFPVWS